MWVASRVFRLTKKSIAQWFSFSKSLLLPLLPLYGYRRCCQTVSRLSGLPCRCQGDHRLLHKQTLTNTWQLSRFRLHQRLRCTEDAVNPKSLLYPHPNWKNALSVGVQCALCQRRGAAAQPEMPTAQGTCPDRCISSTCRWLSPNDLESRLCALSTS